MFVTLLLVPITLNYLDNITFGVWMTLSSILTLLNFFDIGLGNGLRNKLSESLSVGDISIARAYVSTSYWLFGVIQIVLFLLFLTVNFIIPWQNILNTNIQSDILKQVSLILFIGVSTKLVLDLLTFVLYAVQEAAKASLLVLFSNILTLFFTYLISKNYHNDLFVLAIATALPPVIVLLISSLVFYQKSLNYIKPNLYLFKKKYIDDLLGIGYKFFFLQLAVVIIFYTDNLVITQLFGPSKVAQYNISFRYFNIISTVFSILIAPYWSAFTEAGIKKEYGWMKNTYSKLWWFWYGVVICVIIFVLISPFAFRVWVGDKITVPLTLSIAMGASVVIACFNNVTVSVINGLGRIKLQMFSAFFSASINIPVAIFLGKYLNMGVVGVITATSLSLLVSSFVCGIQARRLIRQTAYGIWNQ